jgi:hypothetical protein
MVPLKTKNKIMENLVQMLLMEMLDFYFKMEKRDF